MKHHALGTKAILWAMPCLLVAFFGLRPVSADTFALWATRVGVLADPVATPGNDGISSLLKYGFAVQDPSTPRRTLTPQTVALPDGRLAITYFVAASAFGEPTDLILVPEFSNDLSLWSRGPAVFDFPTFSRAYDSQGVFLGTSYVYPLRATMSPFAEGAFLRVTPLKDSRPPSAWLFSNFGYASVDPTLDPDFDGRNILREFLDGTDPAFFDGSAGALTYGTWGTKCFPLGGSGTGPTDSPARDGVPNLIKYALGRFVPNASERTASPRLVLDPDGVPVLTFTIRQWYSPNYYPSDLNYVPEATKDLVNWFRGNTIFNPPSSNVIFSNGNYSEVEYRYRFKGFPAAAGGGAPADPSIPVFVRLTTLAGQTLPFDWLAHYFPNGGPNAGSSADPDGDGRTNLQEYIEGSDPTDFYNSVNGAISIVSGNSQSGLPESRLPEPLVVNVGLGNAPVRFTTSSAGVTFSPGASSTITASSLIVTSDASGMARAWVNLPAVEGVTVQMTAVRDRGAAVPTAADSANAEASIDYFPAFPLVAPSWFRGRILIPENGSMAVRLEWPKFGQAVPKPSSIVIDRRRLDPAESFAVIANLVELANGSLPVTYDDTTALAGVSYEYRISTLWGQVSSLGSGPDGEKTITVWTPIVDSVVSAPLPETVYSDTASTVSATVSGPSTMVAAPFYPEILKVGRVQGYATGSSTSLTVQFFGEGVATGALAPQTGAVNANHHSLMVRTGALTGISFRILNNTNDSITIEASATELTGHPTGGFLAVDDLVTIHRHQTLGELYPTDPYSAGTFVGIFLSGAYAGSATADLTYQRDAHGVWRNGATDVSTESMTPFRPILLTQSTGGSPRYLFQGFLLGHRTVSKIPILALSATSEIPIGSAAGFGQTLGTAAFGEFGQPGVTQVVRPSISASQAELVKLGISEDARSYYPYSLAPTWYLVGQNFTQSESEPLPAGAGFILRLRNDAPASARYWIQLPATNE